MHARLSLVAISCLILWPLSSRAADLSQVDRTIRKEPAYQTKTPYYCLLVFGPAAKTKVWVVLDGTDLYVDTNGDGDLTAPAKRFPKDGADFKPFEIADAAGTDRYLVRRIDVDRDNQFDLILEIDVETKGRFFQRSSPMLTVPKETAKAHPQHGLPLLSTRAHDAPICHFNGPLTVDVKRVFWESREELVAGDHPADLHLWVTTFDRAHGCLVIISSIDIPQTDLRPGIHHVPAEAFPVVEVEYPPRQPGSPPVRERYELRERC